MEFFSAGLYILGLYENNRVNLIYVIKTLSVAVNSFASLGTSVASVAFIRMSLVYLFNFFLL